MSIESRITAIEDHLTADYEGLENIGADLTGINKNILNIRTVLDNIYNDLPKITGEGTEITLAPTKKGRLIIVPKGNSTQFTTTGKNLFSGLVKGTGLNSSTGAEEPNNDKATSDYIPVDFNTNSNYYLNGLTNTIASFVNAYNSSKQSLGRTSAGAYTYFSLTSSSFSNGTPQGTGDIAYIRVTQYKRSADTGTIDDIDNLKIMLNVGSSAEPYEPYTRWNTSTKPNFSRAY